MPRAMTKDEIRAKVLQILEEQAPAGTLYGNAGNAAPNAAGTRVRVGVGAACTADLDRASREVDDVTQG